MQLRTKKLDEFIECDNIYGSNFSRDAIHYFKGDKHSIQFNKDEVLPPQNFVMHLANGIVFPDHVLRQPIRTGDRHPMPHPLHYAWGNLILTSNYELTVESFSRRIIVPPCLDYEGNGMWGADLPDVEEEIEGPCILLDLFCSHFGHALVDTPARAWFLGEDEFRGMKSPRLIAFPSHGLKVSPQNWPQYLKVIVTGLGVDPDSVIFPRAPVKCRSLYVPRRLSPYGFGGVAHPYFRSMAEIARSIPRSEDLSGGLIYLSRSRLPPGLRGLAGGVESKIEAIFERYGFKIVHPQEISFGEQIDIVRSAIRVAGCVGSQLHLAVFSSQENVKMFRIAPSFFNQATDAIIMKGVGGRATTFVAECDPQPGSKGNTSTWSLTEQQLLDLESAVECWMRG